MEIFEKYLVESAGAERAGRVMEALSGAAATSIRLNPNKPTPALSLPITGDVPWNSKYGKILGERPVFTLDPLFHAGAYYVQESSAMIVGHILRSILDSSRFEPASGGVCVLDLCAAPGGKTTDAAASLRERFADNFSLLANEVIRQRAAVLSDNVAIWGDPCVSVSSSDPSCIGRALKGRFDIIIADVPCSGEGMFRKEATAKEQWSEDNVALCAARQKRIISDVWPALKEGGILIYSTCTFNRHENDENVQWICENLGAEPISPSTILIPQMPGYDGPMQTEFGYLCLPGLVPGEGQYAAALRKGTPEPEEEVKPNRRPDRPNNKSNNKGKDAQKWPGVNLIWDSEQKYIMKGRDKIPTADLVLDFTTEKDLYPRIELTRAQALSFLHKDSLSLPGAPLGYLIVTYGGLPLGLVKNIGNRANNMHPSSRRILMNIEGK